VIFDRELTNFTYPLANEDEIVTVVAEALGTDAGAIAGYLRETKEDFALTGELEAILRRRRAGRRAWFGGRLVWYALVRALKPEVVVETGIHKGLGSALLLRALTRNVEEGAPGRLISFDLDPEAGWLVADERRSLWTPVYESTYDALERVLEEEGLEVSMLIHDSGHTYECEEFEYRVALEHAAPRLALVSRAAGHTTALRDLCTARGVAFHSFAERPRMHWYPGARMGFGFFDRS
jgi:hypothetical protein